MKITKPGTKPKPVFVGDCRACGAEFEAERHELEVETSMRNEEMAPVKCPQCGEKSWMYPKPRKGPG